MPKYQDPSLSGSVDSLFTSVSLYKITVKKGYRVRVRVSPVEYRQIRVHLFFMYLPHTKFQDPSISES